MQTIHSLSILIVDQNLREVLISILFVVYLCCDEPWSQFFIKIQTMIKLV